MPRFTPEEHVDVLLRAHRLVGLRLNQKFAAGGAVPPTEARVLALLAKQRERRLRMDELTELLGMTKGAVSRIVDRVQKAGYVERQGSPADKRAVYAVLTSEGLNALRRVTTVLREVFDEVFLSALSSDELDQLSDLLTRLVRENEKELPASVSRSRTKWVAFEPDKTQPNS